MKAFLLSYAHEVKHCAHEIEVPDDYRGNLYGDPDEEAYGPPPGVTVGSNQDIVTKDDDRWQWCVDFAAADTGKPRTCFNCPKHGTPQCSKCPIY